MKNRFDFQDPGEGIHEAEVLEVLVSEGDSVDEGQDVMVVETDKAAFELAAPRSGTVESIAVRPGQTVHVGDALLTFGDETADDQTIRAPRKQCEPRARDRPE